jgi:MFS family permease
MCLAAPKNFAGFAAVRFLLGFAEGAVSPSFITMTAIWYRKSEHSSRTALWVTMNGIAQVIGCLLMYGVARNSSLSLQPWRTLFLICGAITSVAGIAFYFIVPSGPKDAWFFTPREKEVMALRMAADREGGDKTNFSMAQLKETLLDPKAWFVFWFGVLVTMQSPVLTFASLVIKSLGADKFQTILYTAPSGAVQILLLWIGVLLCYLLPRNRTAVAFVLCIPPLVGNVLLTKLTVSAGWGLIVASWLVCFFSLFYSLCTLLTCFQSSCITAPWSILLSLTASNSKGNTKRAIVNAMFFIGYCAGCIASPQLWTHGPRYFSGVVTSIVTWCLLATVVLAYWYVCWKDNKSRDAEELEQTDSEGGMALDENGLPVGDMTDKEDRRFRYSY